MKKGFTLAEILTTLLIIGVIAAIWLPSLLNNVMHELRQEQARMSIVKLTKAMELMVLKGEIKEGAFSDTNYFVNHLQKYLKMPNRCGANGCPSCFLNCWEARQFQNGDDILDITSAVDGSWFNNQNDDTHRYNGYNVSFQTADGVIWVITWNTACPTMKPGEYPWAYENGKPVTNATTSCITGMLDVNGKSGPNVVGEDIYLFNVGNLGSECAVKIGSQCYATPKVVPPIDYATCIKYKDSMGMKQCFDYGDDYWAGAVLECGKIARMMVKEDLKELSDIFYGEGSITGDIWNVYSSLSYTSGTASSMGLPEPSFTVWNGYENTNGYTDSNISASTIRTWAYTFNSSSTQPGNPLRYNNSGIQAYYALCKR